VPTSSHNANKISSTRCASLLAISHCSSLSTCVPRSASVSAAVSAVCLYCLHGCIANTIVRRSLLHTTCRTTHKVNREVDDKTRDHKVAYMAYEKSLLNTIRLYCTWQRQPAIGIFCLAFCSERIQASSCIDSECCITSVAKSHLNLAILDLESQLFEA